MSRRRNRRKRPAHCAGKHRKARVQRFTAKHPTSSKTVAAAAARAKAAEVATVSGSLRQVKRSLRKMGRTIKQGLSEAIQRDLGGVPAAIPVPTLVEGEAATE